MDVVGLLGAIQKKARAESKTPSLERCMYELAEKFGLTQDEIDQVEVNAREYGGHVAYQP